MVKETGVSLYGLTYPEHAEDHFKEMMAHNCNAVLLAIMEFDLEFWYPSFSIPSIICQDVSFRKVEWHKNYTFSNSIR